ncbi:hypothetical protein B0H65DRAFT_420756 [Neurospora tetraspora]|uniref:CENP-V/GFA domain-containing protein n=1 Tax=Neurospora tetraspora TaxID=94610 RepID=A0AAE0JK27_9PEZI|nr:hypothetical protein B0H65DRAFT_420756 [Neurospora tetraspora]
MNTPPLTIASSASPTETITDTTGTVLKGNCHCGRYRFEYSLPDGRRLHHEAVRCTCTLCSKKGYIWLPSPSTPSEGELKWTRDDGCMTKYQTPMVWDQFCKDCGTGVVGVHSYGPLKGQVLVNVRAIQGVKPFFLESVIKTVNLEEEGPFWPLPLGRDVLYNGSCHCGKVQFELKNPGQGLEKLWAIKEDNCSSCVRVRSTCICTRPSTVTNHCDAFVGIYPSKDHVFIPEEAYNETFEYLYNQRANGLRHCSTCGVMVFMMVYGPPDLAEKLKQLEERNPERYKVAKKMVEANLKLQPLNVRTLERVDWYEIRQRVERTDTGTEGYVLADIEESESDDDESEEESTKKRKETKATELESSELSDPPDSEEEEQSEEESTKKRKETKATELDSSELSDPPDTSSEEEE